MNINNVDRKVYDLPTFRKAVQSPVAQMELGELNFFNKIKKKMNLHMFQNKETKGAQKKLHNKNQMYKMGYYDQSK